MMRIFFIVSFFFLLFSCIKEAKVKLPDAKPLPVMYSYICPTDSLIRLKLMLSSPLYNSNQIDIMAAVSDADVKISSAQGTAQLIFNQNTEFYELKTNSYPIVPGQVYKMTVTTINGDVATAETQVPFTTVAISLVTLETIQESSGISDRIKVSFTDEPGSVNYYRIAALHGFVYTSQTDTVKELTRINELYSDINQDGESAILGGKSYFEYDSTKYYSTEYYDVILYNCSPSYYNFHKSLRNYTGGGVSFSESTLIYTNVTGGFGCFGAYIQSSLRYIKK